MKALSAPASALKWGITLSVATIAFGLTIGGCILFASQSQDNTVAHSAAPRANALDDAITRNPIGSVDRALAARQSLATVRDASLQRTPQPAAALSNADLPMSFSLHEGTEAPDLGPITTGPITNDIATTDILFAPPASRWLTEQTGATRVLALHSTSAQPLLYHAGAAARPAGDAIERDTPAWTIGRTGVAINDLLNEDITILDVERGIDEAQPILIDDPADDDPADLGKLDQDNSADPSQAFDADDSGIGVIPPTFERNPGQPTAQVPEPIAVPVLLGAWILFFRSRRNRAELARLHRLLAEGSSFKLPPGASDRTLDQLVGAARSAGSPR